MKHNEAVEKLGKLAGDRPWSLTYEWASYYDDNPHIRAYIAGPGHAEPARIYADAIRNMEIMLADYSPTLAGDDPPEDGGGKP